MVLIEIINMKLQMKRLILFQIFEKYFEFLNKYEKLIAQEIDSKYEDYEYVNQKEKNIY